MALNALILMEHLNVMTLMSAIYKHARLDFTVSMFQAPTNVGTSTNVSSGLISAIPVTSV